MEVDRSTGHPMSQKRHVGVSGRARKDRSEEPSSLYSPVDRRMVGPSSPRAPQKSFAMGLPRPRKVTFTYSALPGIGAGADCADTLAHCELLPTLSQLAAMPATEGDLRSADSLEGCKHAATEVMATTQHLPESPSPHAAVPSAVSPSATSGGRQCRDMEEACAGKGMQKRPRPPSTPSSPGLTTAEMPTPDHPPSTLPAPIELPPVPQECSMALPHMNPHICGGTSPNPACPTHSTSTSTTTSTKTVAQSPLAASRPRAASTPAQVAWDDAHLVLPTVRPIRTRSAAGPVDPGPYRPAPCDALSLLAATAAAPGTLCGGMQAQVRAAMQAVVRSRDASLASAAAPLISRAPTPHASTTTSAAIARNPFTCITDRDDNNGGSSLGQLAAPQPFSYPVGVKMLPYDGPVSVGDGGGVAVCADTAGQVPQTPLRLALPSTEPSIAALAASTPAAIGARHALAALLAVPAAAAAASGGFNASATTAAVATPHAGADNEGVATSPLYALLAALTGQQQAEAPMPGCPTPLSQCVPPHPHASALDTPQQQQAACLPCQWQPYFQVCPPTPTAAAAVAARRSSLALLQRYEQQCVV